VSVAVREVPGLPERAFPASSAQSEARRRNLLHLAVAMAAAEIFLFLHFILELRSQHETWQFFARVHGQALARQIIGSIWPDLLAGMAVFVGIELSAVALAARGRTRTFWLPALVWVITPAVFGEVGLAGRLPAALGSGWIAPVAYALKTHHIVRIVWLGAFADLGLALIPAATIAFRSRERPVQRSRTDPVLRGAALGFCLFLLWLILSTRATAVDARFPWAEAPTMVPLFLFGLLLGMSRPARPWLWAAAVVPLLLMTSWVEVFYYSGVGVVTTLAKSLPWVGLTALGLAPGPLGVVLEAARDRRILLAVAVNVFNVGDAVLTFIETHSIGVREANPVINGIGLPAKILLVAVITLVLARRRPRVLLWPALALLGVVGWHIAGMYLSARLT